MWIKKVYVCVYFEPQWHLENKNSKKECKDLYIVLFKDPFPKV